MASINRIFEKRKGDHCRSSQIEQSRPLNSALGSLRTIECLSASHFHLWNETNIYLLFQKRFAIQTLFNINILFASQALAGPLCTSGIGVPLARTWGWGDLVFCGCAGGAQGCCAAEMCPPAQSLQCRATLTPPWAAATAFNSTLPICSAQEKGPPQAKGLERLEGEKCGH